MPRGHYDRHEARLHREAAQQAPITIVERPAEPQLPDPMVFPPADEIDGHPVHFDPVRVDLSLGAEPPHPAPVFDEDHDDARPVRVLMPHSFYDDDGALHSWVAGQLVSDPATIALLTARNVQMTDDVGDTNGLALAARPLPHQVSAPASSPLRLAAPYEFYDEHGVLHSWVKSEYVSNPETARLLRERGAFFVDAE